MAPLTNAPTLPTGAVALSGGMVMILFRYMQKNVMTDPECVPPQADHALHLLSFSETHSPSGPRISSSCSP